MVDKVEVRIVGDESNVQAAMRRAAQTVQEATQTMRNKLGDIRESSREAFGGMGRDVREGADDVNSSMRGISGTLDNAKSHFESFMGGFKKGWREADEEIKRAHHSTEQLRDELGRFRSTQGAGGGAGGGGPLGMAMSVFKGGLMLEAVAKLRDIAVGTVETASEFELLRSVLLTLEGSVSAANGRFSELKKFGTETPYELSEVVTAFAKLKAQGLDPSNEALRSYGNTASAMGKSLDQMIEAVGDASRGEFERLKEFGIVAQDAGDKVKLSFQGVTTEVEKNSADIQKYLQNIGNVNFAGAMDRQMDTLGGKFSNLTDAAANFADQMGQGGLSGALKGAMDDMTGATGTSGTLAASIGQVLGVAINGVVGIIKTFSNIVSDHFAFVKQIVTDTMGKSAGASVTWENALHVLGATVAGFAGVVRGAFTIVAAVLQSGANAFITFQQVVGAALDLDFDRMTNAVRDGVNRQVGIVSNAMSRIKSIVGETKQSIGDAWKPVTTPPAVPAPAAGGAIAGAAFGGGRGGGRTGGRSGAGSGPSEMDLWRTDLQDQVLAQERAGRDTLQLTADFWEKKLALTKAGTKQQIEVRRELTRAQIALNRAEDQETLAQIRDTQQLKINAANAEVEISKIGLEQKLANLDAERQAGLISETTALARRAAINQEKLALDRELEQRQFDIKLAALNDELKLYAIDTRQYRNHLRDIEILKRQHDQRILILGQQAALQERRDENALAVSKRQALNGWTQAWSQQLAKMVTLQQGFSGTVKGIWDSMQQSFSQAIARMIQQWIMGLVIKEAATTASQRREVLKTAKEAAAGAFSAIAKIPIVGPILAPAAAAAAFAATLAFSAKDGYDVPALAGPGIDGKGGQLGVVHPREMVLPADIADSFRNGGSGGGLPPISIQALDAKSVRRLFEDHGSDLAHALRKHVRNGGR